MTRHNLAFRISENIEAKERRADCKFNVRILLCREGFARALLANRRVVVVLGRSCYSRIGGDRREGGG